MPKAPAALFAQPEAAFQQKPNALCGPTGVPYAANENSFVSQASTAAVAACLRGAVLRCNLDLASEFLDVAYLVVGESDNVF